MGKIFPGLHDKRGETKKGVKGKKRIRGQSLFHKKKENWQYFFWPNEGGKKRGKGGCRGGGKKEKKGRCASAEGKGRIYIIDPRRGKNGPKKKKKFCAAQSSAIAKGGKGETGTSLQIFLYEPQ